MLESNPDLVPELFEYFDLGENGGISFEHMIDTYNLKIEFDKLNLDGDLGITAMELNQDFEWPEVKRVFEKFDTDTVNAKLEFLEFEKYHHD